jgi:hypothetical protein
MMLRPATRPNRKSMTACDLALCLKLSSRLTYPEETHVLTARVS